MICYQAAWPGYHRTLRSASHSQGVLYIFLAVTLPSLSCGRFLLTNATLCHQAPRPEPGSSCWYLQTRSSALPRPNAWSFLRCLPARGFYHSNRWSLIATSDHLIWGHGWIHRVWFASLARTALVTWYCRFSSLSLIQHRSPSSRCVSQYEWPISRSLTRFPPLFSASHLCFEE